MYVSLRPGRVVLSMRAQIQMSQSELSIKHVASGRHLMAGHKGFRKAEEVNFKANFSFVTSLSTAEKHAFGVKFIGLYGTVIFITIRDFSC